MDLTITFAKRQGPMDGKPSENGIPKFMHVRNISNKLTLSETDAGRKE